MNTKTLFFILSFVSLESLATNFTFDQAKGDSFPITYEDISKACFDFSVREERINQKFENSDGSTTFVRPRVRFSGYEVHFYNRYSSSSTSATESSEVFCEQMGFKTHLFTLNENKKGPLLAIAIDKQNHITFTRLMDPATLNVVSEVTCK